MLTNHTASGICPGQHEVSAQGTEKVGVGPQGLLDSLWYPLSLVFDFQGPDGNSLQILPRRLACVCVHVWLCLGAGSMHLQMGEHCPQEVIAQMREQGRHHGYDAGHGSES